MKNKYNAREHKLLYRAERKNLCIQKELGLHGRDEYCYLISKSDSGLVLTGYNHWKNLLTLDEAEEFVAEYHEFIITYRLFHSISQNKQRFVHFQASYPLQYVPYSLTPIGVTTGNHLPHLSKL